ncbi:hypothetical protein FKM82_023968 [Ascaphus truei]
MWSLLELLLTLLGFLFIVQYLKIKWVARSLPPGPTPLPVMGPVDLSFVLHPENLRQLAKSYGNIYTVWLGQTPLVVLNGCRTVRDALVSHSEELSGRPVASFMQDISRGRGIGVANGHTWKQHRRFGLMTLRNLGLGKLGLESRIWEEAQSLVESFAAENGKPMDPSYLIIHAVANVISAVVFGHRFSIDDLTFQKLVACNNTLLESMGSKWGRMYDAFPWLMRHIPGPHQEVFVKKEYLDTFIRKEIQIHQENRSLEEPQDVIDHYLAQIIKDTMILPNLDSVLHDPQHWETPNQFNPNHFLDKEGNFFMNEAFLPFSAGHRVCLGEQLARIELLLFFTSLLRAFSFQLPQGVTEVNLKYVLKMTLAPNPYKICAIRR